MRQCYETSDEMVEEGRVICWKSGKLPLVKNNKKNRERFPIRYFFSLLGIICMYDHKWSFLREEHA